jgi:hypothetical protein
MVSALGLWCRDKYPGMGSVKSFCKIQINFVSHRSSPSQSKIAKAHISAPLIISRKAAT